MMTPEFVEFINHVTGTTMYVAADRVEEYKAAGHKPVAEPVKEEKKPAPKKAVRKR